METLFAPSEKASLGSLKHSVESLATEMPYHRLLDLMPNICFIVNPQRQIIFANSVAISAFCLNPDDVVGARCGDIFGCIHAEDMPGGCGTSESCSVCGAVNAVVETLGAGGRSERECRISARKGGRFESLDYRVVASRLASTQSQLVLVTLVDISDLKRREILERSFFHDVINSISNVQAGMRLMQHEFDPAVSGHDLFLRVCAATDNLLDEVIQHKQLVTMESGDMEVDFSEMELGKFASETIRLLEMGDFARNRRMVLHSRDQPTLVRTDPQLLRRVLGNMLKNALEASREGEVVELRVEQGEGEVAISVHNSGCIPREVQLQLFQRFFSTKGKGRGIGTYSMKMIAENYLKGRIEFSSVEGEGTRFSIILPLAPAG